MNLFKLSFFLYLMLLLLATIKLRHWNDCITKCRLHVYAVPVLVSLILFLKKSCKVSKPIVSLSCLCVEVSCKTVPLRKKILLINNFFLWRVTVLQLCWGVCIVMQHLKIAVLMWLSKLLMYIEYIYMYIWKYIYYLDIVLKSPLQSVSYCSVNDDPWMGFLIVDFILELLDVMLCCDIICFTIIYSLSYWFYNISKTDM